MFQNILALLPLPLFYALGALPTGYLLARTQGLDISKHGSGNIGATNVARVLGKKFGALTLAVDAGKGFVATLIASLISSGSLEYIALAALICMAGHCFSWPGKLAGGKGVATALGTLFGLNYWLPVVALIVFVFSMLAFRIVSVASLCATTAVVIAANILSLPDHAWFALALMSLIIFYKHKDNLRRLALGQEPRFSL